MAYRNCSGSGNVGDIVALLGVGAMAMVIDCDAQALDTSAVVTVTDVSPTHGVPA